MQEVFKRKSIQNRLFISYSILFITVLAVLTVLLHFTFRVLLNDSTNEVLLQNATNINKNFDALVEKMDGMLKQVIFSDTINDEFFQDTEPGKGIFLPLESRRKISNEMYSILGPNFSTIERIELIDTKSGNYLSIGTTKLETVVSRRSIDSAAWIKDVLCRNGLLTIVSPHKDAFSPYADTKVICVARAYKSREAMSYSSIVYIPYQTSKLITSLSEAKWANKYIKEVYLYDESFQMICGTGQKYDFPESLRQDDLTTGSMLMQEDGELVLCQNSTVTGWTVLIKADKTMMSTPTKTTYSILLGTLLAAMVAVLLMSLQLSKRFTTPIAAIYKDMKDISLLTANIEPIISSEEDASRDELETLSYTFHRLCDRLDTAIEEAALARYAENEAKVAAMEAEINPHFLYNTFAVIRNYGDVAHVPEIAEICDNLSALLRYAVSENNEAPTIGSEVDSCMMYLNIMHIRNYDRLSYSVDIDDRMVGCYMPRMILQPIVENCFLHGLMPKEGLWQITIRGYVENDSWYIEITDNGIGFDENLMERLHASLTSPLQMEQQSTGHKKIGLNNIITRLKLRFGTDLVFRITNRKENGSCVTIGVVGGMKVE